MSRTDDFDDVALGPVDEFYREGWEAFLTQGVEAECPYPIGSGDPRTGWWVGYLEARTLGRVRAMRRPSRRRMKKRD